MTNTQLKLAYLFPLPALLYISFIFIKTPHIGKDCSQIFQLYHNFRRECLLPGSGRKENKRRNNSGAMSLHKLITKAVGMDTVSSLSPVLVHGAVFGISPVRKGVLKKNFQPKKRQR